MKLSAELFAELSATFDAKQMPSQHERRRAARLELPAKVKIIPIVSGQRLEPTHIMVADFSTRGMSFLHTFTMEQGRQFITEFPRKSGGVVEVLCTVVHCVPVGNNVWRSGAEFTCQLPRNQPDLSIQEENEQARRIRESMLK